jgi:hypothetical protein
MRLLSPASLLIFIPLGAVIVLLYLLKLKRKEHVVSSVMLWLDAIADIQANAPFQKLRKNLLLILQLAILLLLILALARPYARVKGLSENKIVVILDSSASMQATDVSPSRFDAAKSKIAGLVNSMGAGDTMLVMAVAEKSKVVVPFTSDKKALLRSLSLLKPTDASCRMRQAVALALSLAAGKAQTPARIVVVSDGGFDPLSDLEAGGVRLEFVRVGSGCDNVGITGMASRKSLSGEQQVFIAMQNFSKNERRFNLEINVNDRLFDIREEKLAAGASKQEILDNVGNVSGRVTAKLDIKDDLHSDDVASVYLNGRRKLSVLMVSKGDIFLQNALNLDTRTQLVTTDGLPSDFKSRRYDLTVFDGVQPPPDLPPGGYLLVNASAPDGPAEAGKSLTRPSITDWSRKHPATSFVDFSGTQIIGARALSPKSWAVPIVEAGNDVLAVAGKKNGRSFVQLSWSLMESDFPLRVGFPIFIANCLDWLSPTQGEGSGESVRTGQAISIDVPPGVSEVSVTDPANVTHAIKITQSPMIFDATDLVGTYKVTGRGVNREFACNLCSSQESNIAPTNSFKVGNRSIESHGDSLRTNKEFYWPVILLALLLLTFEWYAYHRRL